MKRKMGVRFGKEEMGIGFNQNNVHVYMHNKTYIHLNHLENLMLIKIFITGMNAILCIIS